MTARPGDARNAGLDLLRALAIVLVVVYHWRVFVAPQPALGWVGAFGWVGVDLFFVLSGYLIADQLLRGLVAGRRLSVTSFWARRALRTWPAFFVVLAAYALWPAALGGRGGMPPLWRFATFTQNLWLQPGTVFSHAWSLCIEEQFYLLLPLAVLALGAARGTPAVRRRRAWAWIAGLTAAAVALRALLWLRFGTESGGDLSQYHPWVYYATWARADEFLPGVAVALLRHGHPLVWARLSAQGGRWLAAGLVACALLAVALQHHYVNDDGYGFVMTAFGYSAIAWAFALLVLAALCPGSPLQRLRLPGVAALARWSYAIYLTHKAVAHVLAPMLARAGLQGWGRFAAVMLACVAVGWLLHRLVERPFLAWRDRAVPSIFGAPKPHATAGAAHA